MSETLIKKIEAEIKKLEAESKNGLVTSDSVEQSRTMVKNLSKLAKLSEEQLNDYNSRIDAVASKLTKSIKLNAKPEVVANEANEVRKHVAPRVAAALVAFTVAAGSIAACTKEEKAVEPEAQVEDVKLTAKATTMDPEYKEMADQALLFAQNELENGLPKDAQFTEDNKDKMSESLVEYYFLNQMDELTDEEWANIFQNSNVTATDLMNAKASWEWFDQQRVVVSDNVLDYSLLFDGKDAELLSKSAELLNKIKSTKGSEKDEAIANFKEYIIENLGKENNRMQYSERALDTFRAVYFDAFDELTNHKVVDDELEHAINTTITCSIKESDLKVEDPTIQSLQSEFEVYETEKLELRFQNGWNYAALNADSINDYNDISYIAEYVSNNLDLSKQTELADYEETLNAMFLVNDGKGKSADDSGVSNGKGGVISKKQLDKYGISADDPNAKAKLEQAVESEQSEITTVTTNDGTVINQNTNDAKADYTNGYNDGMSNAPRKEGASTSYNLGYEAGSAYRQSFDNSQDFSEHTEYQPVDGAATTTEQTTEYNYTENNNYVDNSNVVTNTTTTFESVDGDEVVVEETITTQDYIGRLESLRNTLVAQVDNDINISKYI